MELKFQDKQISCLQQLDCREQIQEQSQEVRLGENMPDIGRVLCSWGQVLLRGKEWHGSIVGVSGGVMTWTMYEPEEGGNPRTVESWIPFSQKWELSDSKSDGEIQCSMLLKSVDARSTSARKMVVRAAVSVETEIMAYGQINLYEPQNLPEDVQLLQHTYPVKMPREAGEKAFDLDEILDIPVSTASPAQLVYYSLQPEIADQKVMTDKVVFRGTAQLHMLYRSEEGTLNFWDTEIPFSQYSDLEREHEVDSEASISPCVTSLELEQDENGTLHLKAGFVGQYVIYDTENICSMEDIYSYKRNIEPIVENIQIPAILDTQSSPLAAESHVSLEGSRIADLSFNPDRPAVRKEDTGVQVETAGYFQVLYWDLEGKLQCSTQYWSSSQNIPADSECQVRSMLAPSGRPRGNLNGGQGDFSSDMNARTVTWICQGIPVISGLEMGEPEVRKGPSLIISKTGESSLWQLAKESGSTVDAIKTLNHLEEEPEGDRILLIPVL